MARTWLILVPLLCLAAACGDDGPPPEDRDGGDRSDAGGPDGAIGRDTGAADDGGSPDAETPDDAAMHAQDAAMHEHDAAMPDAGADAGAADAAPPDAAMCDCDPSSCEWRTCGPSECGILCGACDPGEACYSGRSCVAVDPRATCPDAFGAPVPGGEWGMRTCPEDPALVQRCICEGAPDIWIACGPCVPRCG